MLAPLTELFICLLICLFKDSVNIAQHIALNMNIHIVQTKHHILHQSYRPCTIFYTIAGQIQSTREPHNSQGLARGTHWCTHLSKLGGGIYYNAKIYNNKLTLKYG
jgi:hypothetical protein